MQHNKEERLITHRPPTGASGSQCDATASVEYRRTRSCTPAEVEDLVLVRERDSDDQGLVCRHKIDFTVELH